MADRVGQQLGNYHLIRLLGRGGFAEVYLGEHLRLGTQVAIKVLHTSLEDEDVEGFLREAQMVARLRHLHIVRVFDFDVENHTPFLVMDYLPNGNVRLSHPRGTPLPLPTIISYVTQVASALQYAHDEKLIHRDIKPENMLLDRDKTLVLSDFGIALMSQSSRFQSTQEVAGTAAYMAPEQFQGHPHRASDQYALAVVVYEWLTGDHPFHGSFSEIASQHLFVPPPPLREKMQAVTPDVEQVVMTALEKYPRKRFNSVKAFATALEQASLSVQQVSSVPDQSLRSNVTETPPTQYGSPIPTFSSIQPLPNHMSRLPIEPLVAKKGTSRRVVLMGLVLAVATGTSSITWFVLSQRSQVPPISSSPNRTLHTTSTSTPNATSKSSSHSPSIGTTLLTYHGHSDWMASAAWSPDDKRIASSGNDQTIQVWDASNGSTIFIYRGHSACVNAAAWSPDGKRIGSGSNDRTVQVWDAFTGNNVLTYRGHTDIVRTVAWSPDGARIASAGHDTTAQVWDASSGIRIFTYHGHSSRVACLAWSPDGKHIASASDDMTVQVWDAFTGNNVLTYRGHTDVVVKVAWSPVGTYIVSASGDRTAQVWDGITGRNITTYRGHSSGLDAVAWSSNGQQVASSSNDHTVQIWDATGGITIFIYRGHSVEVNALGWSHGGTRIVSGDNSASVQVWQAS